MELLYRRQRYQRLDKKNELHPAACGAQPKLKELTGQKELASGFHFIPDRLNEAHGEGMGVTFSG